GGAGAGDEHRADDSGPAWHPELKASQVESATGICTTSVALHEQLLEGRRRLGVAAADEGLLLPAAGMRASTSSAAGTVCPVSGSTSRNSSSTPTVRAAGIGDLPASEWMVRVLVRCVSDR
ncbi:hypothetical protein ACZ91_37515, partial [Streptomyces regensis]